ncbi:MAG TPA: LCP family protein [Candidatus Limnocylindria bacterium]|nr:LCP family protein [Candidatus Limnocylindria bacterium]
MRGPRRIALSLSLAVVMAGAGAAGPVAASVREFDALPWLGLAAQLASPVFPSAISKGGDNRLTVLLVGSDWRPRLQGTGERTDSIIVMTINNNQISAVSLPRDVGNVPIAPGVIYKPKINGLFKWYKSQSGLSDPIAARNWALQKMRTAFEYTFAIQIDYVVYTRFTALERLVGNVDGVPVTVAKTVYDNSIVDERYPDKQHGAKFLSQFTVERGADAPACYTVGSPIDWDATPNCTRALEYVRTRHGPGNNDWVRGRRQQSFIYSAIRRVIARGNGSNLESLRTSALSNSTDFYTSMPTGPSDALSMFALLQNATMPNQAVLQPSKYAFTVPGTYKQELKIDVVRDLMHTWFGPLN